MKIAKLKIENLKLPDTPGVYYFKRNKEILYVGKATSLKDRVKSYFTRDILMTRSPLISKMLEEASAIEFKTTDSVLEALILEANEIKKHQPHYNSREKDDKSYNYVVITKEDFPQILLMRGRELEKNLQTYKLKNFFGPFPHGSELKEALKITRKIFPYRDDKCKIGSKPCFNAQIGLCPGPCAGWISKADYRKIIRNIKLFFEGKKEALIRTLEKEMKELAKKQKFEEADKVKRQLFALNHIHDVALIKHELTTNDQRQTTFRVEAYDIAHISGTNVVGVMTVVEDGEVNKSQYRKFKIKGATNPPAGGDDTKNLKEVLNRRFGHPEWRFPNMVVVDGGRGQINAAEKVLKSVGLEVIKVVSVVKDERHKAREILGLESGQHPMLAKSIMLANSEAHRFAIKYHRLLRSRGFRI